MKATVLCCLHHREEETYSNWLLGDLLGGLILLGVLADYRHLGGAVTENAAPTGGEQGAGTLIRTGALGRFPQGEQLDSSNDGGWTSGENSRPGLTAEHQLVFKSLII